MDENKKISAGLYIGTGPKPDNVDAGMYVDMEGRDVGVYIGAGKPQTLGNLLEKALQDNPTHRTELQSFLDEANTIPKEQVKPFLERIVEWGNRNSGTLLGAANLLVNAADKMLRGS